MASLQWDAPGSKTFESGIDRGVLYVKDSIGVPWVGLKEVIITENGGEPDPQYIEGRKFINTTINSDIEATLSAISIPDEFMPCDGVQKLNYMGLYSTLQERKQFDLSWRTLLGNDLSGTNYAYKIHLLFNITALPSDRNYQSTSNDAQIVQYRYKLSAVPKSFDGRKSTAYVVINSSRYTTSQMNSLTDILYGSSTSNPRMVTPEELSSIFGV